MTSVLVTGGAGYVGSHTSKALRRAGFDPIAYDNLSRGNPEAIKWGALEVGELADSAHLRETLARYRPAAVVHFAALAYVGESNMDPSTYYQNNVDGTAALLGAMREAGVGKIVFSSSCAVYGAPARVQKSASVMFQKPMPSHSCLRPRLEKAKASRYSVIIIRPRTAPACAITSM
jgi:UDP-arabinose 4-epimerase